MTHICVSKLTSIGSDNGLSPGRRQAIIWTNAGILLIRTLGTNFSEILGEIHSFSFSKMHLKISSATWRLFGLGLNELRAISFTVMSHEHNTIPHNQQLHYLFRLTSTKTSNILVTAVTGGSPHKGQFLMWKIFPFHDVTTHWYLDKHSCQLWHCCWAEMD